MSGFIEGVDWDQVTLFSDRLEDWIEEDHLVRVVDLFVSVRYGSPSFQLDGLKFQGSRSSMRFWG